MSTFIEQRIDEIFKNNVSREDISVEDNTTEMKLYFIESSLQGSEMAIEDLHNFIKFLLDKFNYDIDNYSALIDEYTKRNTIK